MPKAAFEFGVSARIVPGWHFGEAQLRITLSSHGLNFGETHEQLVRPIHDEIVLVLLSRSIWVGRRSGTRALLLGLHCGDRIEYQFSRMNLVNQKHRH